MYHICDKSMCVFVAPGAWDPLHFKTLQANQSTGSQTEATYDENCTQDLGVTTQGYFSNVAVMALIR
jgi:hypothetical protein